MFRRSWRKGLAPDLKRVARCSTFRHRPRHPPIRRRSCDAPGATPADPTPAERTPLNPVHRADRLNFLNREAAEVYLLLDFLSGRSDRSMTASPDELGRALLNEQAAKGIASDASTESEIADRARVEADLKDPTRLVLRVMAIKYPLTPGSGRFETDAAFLLRARDVLNYRASPASGATIAFTWMVFRERLRSAGGTWPWIKTLFGADRSARTPAPGLPADGSRSDAAAAFAEEAFPHLRAAAQDLARQIRRIVSWTLPLLLIVVALSAYAAWGKVLLDTIDATRRDFGAIEQSIENLESTDRTAAPASGHAVHLCDRPRLLPQLPAQAGAPGDMVTQFESTAQYHLCDRLDDVNRRMDQSYRHLGAWAHIALFWRSPGTDEQWATAALSVLSNSVMPVLYGVLGAMAYVMRRFHDRLAGSLLTPRDQRANIIRLALGALIGASIGLFFNSGAGTSQASGVLGLAVNLSASALAFLAGYGVEAVFRTLDALMSSVFKIGDGDTAGPAVKR